MSNALLNHELLESIKRTAKQKKRDDPSRGYNQWLDALCAEHGYASFASLSERVADLETEAAKAAEDLVWQQRFATSMVWGTHPDEEKGLHFTLPLPVEGNQIPWPNCFAGSSLFTCGEGARRQRSGPLFSDGPAMTFVGEELRVADDETVLMALMMTIGREPCGKLVHFTTDDLDAAAGPLPSWGIPVEYEAISRSLWRLVHCRLVVPDFKFDGPLLTYVDATHSPKRFAVRFNEQFAHFFYDIFRLFKS